MKRRLRRACPTRWKRSSAAAPAPSAPSRSLEATPAGVTPRRRCRRHIRPRRLLCLCHHSCPRQCIPPFHRWCYPSASPSHSASTRRWPPLRGGSRLRRSPVSRSTSARWRRSRRLPSLCLTLCRCQWARASMERRSSLLAWRARSPRSVLTTRMFYPRPPSYQTVLRPISASAALL